MEAVEAAIEQSHNVVTITFTARDVTAPQMQELALDLSHKMRYDNAQFFVFDMAEVEYLASGCLGSMVELMRDLETMRGRIVLANCNDNVAFIFKVTRLDSVFEMFDDVNEARADVRGG